MDATTHYKWIFEDICEKVFPPSEFIFEVWETRKQASSEEQARAYFYDRIMGLLPPDLFAYSR